MGYDYWSYDSTYRGINIENFFSSQTQTIRYRAYTDEMIYRDTKPEIQSAIDAYLDKLEPADGNGAAPLGGLGLLILLYLIFKGGK